MLFGASVHERLLQQGRGLLLGSIKNSLFTVTNHPFFLQDAACWWLLWYCYCVTSLTGTTETRPPTRLLPSLGSAMVLGRLVRGVS